MVAATAAATEEEWRRYSLDDDIYLLFILLRGYNHYTPLPHFKQYPKGEK
jgi:hypothetical protein